MTHWLSRQEKVSLFQAYVQDYISEDDRNTIHPSALLTLPGVGLVIAQRPTVHGQTLSSIQNLHHAPGFSMHL